jgi:hypothetical protein
VRPSIWPRRSGRALGGIHWFGDNAFSTTPVRQ